MSETARAERIAREVDRAACQLAQAGRLDLTREFIQHGDVTVYAHVTSVARASLSFGARRGRFRADAARAEYHRAPYVSAGTGAADVSRGLDCVPGG